MPKSQKAKKIWPLWPLMELMSLQDDDYKVLKSGNITKDDVNTMYINSTNLALNFWGDNVFRNDNAKVGKKIFDLNKPLNIVTNARGSVKSNQANKFEYIKVETWEIFKTTENKAITSPNYINGFYLWFFLK